VVVRGPAGLFSLRRDDFGLALAEIDSLPTHQGAIDPDLSGSASTCATRVLGYPLGARVRPRRDSRTSRMNVHSHALACGDRATTRNIRAPCRSAPAPFVASLKTEDVGDDLLRLVLIACHPVLSTR